MSRTQSLNQKELLEKSTQDAVQLLAKRIAEELMQNGDKEQAIRIQLRGPHEKDLGGYCRDAVERIIQEQLCKYIVDSLMRRA